MDERVDGGGDADRQSNLPDRDGSRSRRSGIQGLRGTLRDVRETTTPPVVLGSSFSGLVVSLQLSNAGVRHIVVGGPEPAPVPRLGESMIETTGPELWRLLPEARDCYFKKSHISLFDGERVSMIHIGDPGETLEDVARRVVRPDRIRVPEFRTLLMHVDRGRFDPILYRTVRERPECTFVDALATDIATEDDRVTRITLNNGQVLENPVSVFDCTGFRGVVANAVGLEAQPISRPQRVAWGHRVRRNVPNRDPNWWQHGTNLVRLRPEIDGIRGIAWLIPLGERVSFGVSVDADDPAADGADTEALVDCLLDACARRGVDLRALYPEPSTIEEVRHAYTTRERAFGKNWLLVGNTYQSIWFPSSTGVWTTTAAAGLAEWFVRNPRYAGWLYQRFMDRLVHTHAHMAHMIYEGFDDDRSTAWFWSRWLAFIPRRLADYFMIVNRDREERRTVHSLLRRGSDVALKRPLVHQAIFSLPIRIEHPDTLVDQASSFPGYFSKRAFRMRNLIRSVGRILTPRRWPTAWTPEDSTPTSSPARAPAADTSGANGRAASSAPEAVGTPGPATPG